MNRITPFFSYDLNKVREKIEKIKKAFSSYKNFELFYAVKANNNHKILKEFINNDVGLHVSSKEELDLAILLKSKKISFTSPIITKEIVDISKKINFEINLNNKNDLNYFDSNFYKYRLGFRINPLFGWSYGKETKAGGVNSQFGIPLNEITFDYFKKIVRLHCHTSSDCFKQNVFIKQLKILLEIVKFNKNINTINIGGGIAVPITEEETDFCIEDFASKIIAILNKFNKENKTLIKLQIELGNFLVRESGVYTCEIIQIEKKFEKTFIYTNGTKHHLRGIMPDRVIFPLRNNNNVKSIIVGCTCQRGDIILDDFFISNELKIGDKIKILNTGAYYYSQSDNFHLINKPKEYFD